MAYNEFLLLLQVHGLPAPKVEHRFVLSRRWRFDYAWPHEGVAVEVEGGAFAKGRHTRGAGFVLDMEKYNAAAEEGWRVFRYLPEQLTLQRTVDQIKAALANREAP